MRKSVGLKKPIPHYPGYQADSCGNIWSFKRNLSGKKMKLRLNNNYWEVELCRFGKRHYHGVHRLVCSAFHGEPQRGQETRHLNGNTTDNNPQNLSWGTPAENMKDRIRLKTQVGSANGNAKLTASIVQTIRQRSATESRIKLSKVYKLDPSTISNIVLRKTWRHIK